MSRSRNIKPGFFKNEDLAELPFEYRLLYIGLWTEADREGRFEDRPVKLKMAIFPGDTVDVEAGLQALQDKGFILRYASASKRYGQVIAWKKHQNPHFKEQMSVIPSPESLGFDVHAMGSLPQASHAVDDTKASGIGANSVQPDSASNTSVMQKPEALPPVDGGVNPADSLIPDSRYLIPDSLQDQKLLSDEYKKPGSRFAEFWAAYPCKKGRAAAESKWKARNLDAIGDQIIADVQLRSTTDRQWLEGFIPHGSTYVNGKGWEDAIEPVHARAGPGQRPQEPSKTRNGINDLQSMKTHEDLSSPKRLASERDHRRPDEAHDA